MREYTTKREKCRYYSAWAKLQLLKRKKAPQVPLLPQNTNETQENTAKKRILHITEEQYQEKIKQLENRISELKNPEDKNKRKRLYGELSQLKNNVILVDPKLEEEKKIKDQEKRIQKKIQKKQELKRELKQQKCKEKSKTCLICKQTGHTAAHCRENVELVTQVICYNCGSKEHTLKDCPQPKSNNLQFANCFVCKEAGHISRDCPQNPKGLYAFGGGCYICNATTHIQKDCPRNPRNRIQAQRQQEENQEYFSD